MKKISKLIIVAALLIAFAMSASAAWTVTFSKPLSNVYPWSNGTRMIKLVLDVTSDASASGTLVMSTLIDASTTLTTAEKLKWKTLFQGGILYSFKYSHTGTVTAPTVVVYDENGGQIFSEALATSGASTVSSSVDTAHRWPVSDLKFSSTTLGNGGVSRYEFWIMK